MKKLTEYDKHWEEYKKIEVSARMVMQKAIGRAENKYIAIKNEAYRNYMKKRRKKQP
jgi:hypothetical protein